MTTTPRIDKGERREQQVRRNGPVRRFLNGLLWLTKSDSRLYWFYRLTGRSFSDYYAARMDAIAATTPESATGRPEEKRFQTEYLMSQGMERGNRLLDFGCGTGSAAVGLVDYLNPGCYVGADISERCVEVARQRMIDEQLADKKPHFLHLSDEETLNGQFDFIWAQSVLTHVPPDDMPGLLERVIPLLKSNGRFYATFAYTDGEPVHYKYKDWFYPPTFFDELCRNLPLTCEIMDDWVHPTAPIDRMVCFSPQRQSQRAAA